MATLWLKGSGSWMTAAASASASAAGTASASAAPQRAAKCRLEQRCDAYLENGGNAPLIPTFTFAPPPPAEKKGFTSPFAATYGRPLNNHGARGASAKLPSSRRSRRISHAVLHERIAPRQLFVFEATEYSDLDAAAVEALMADSIARSRAEDALVAARFARASAASSVLYLGKEHLAADNACRVVHAAVLDAKRAVHACELCVSQLADAFSGAIVTSRRARSSAKFSVMFLGDEHIAALSACGAARAATRGADTCALECMSSVMLVVAPAQAVQAARYAESAAEYAVLSLPRELALQSSMHRAIVASSSAACSADRACTDVAAVIVAAATALATMTAVAAAQCACTSIASVDEQPLRAAIYRGLQRRVTERRAAAAAFLYESHGSLPEDPSMESAIVENFAHRGTVDYASDRSVALRFIYTRSLGLVRKRGEDDSRQPIWQVLNQPALARRLALLGMQDIIVRPAALGNVLQLVEPAHDNERADVPAEASALKPLVAGKGVWLEETDDEDCFFIVRVPIENSADVRSFTIASLSFPSCYGEATQTMVEELFVDDPLSTPTHLGLGYIGRFAAVPRVGRVLLPWRTYGSKEPSVCRNGHHCECDECQCGDIDSSETYAAETVSVTTTARLFKVSARKHTMCDFVGIGILRVNGTRTSRPPQQEPAPRSTQV